MDITPFGSSGAYIDALAGVLGTREGLKRVRGYHE